jgi:hypothetical protein
MRGTIALLSLALLAAAPSGKPTIIPLSPDDDEALVIPAGSPAHFTGFDETHTASFTGRFTLTGTFFYGCEIECQLPLHEEDLFAAFIPDPASKALLPHWKLRNGDMRIYFDNGDKLVAQLVTKKEKAALIAGKLPAFRKQVTIVVTDFKATIECDSASYSIKFVALAKPPQIARAKVKEDYGCG